MALKITNGYVARPQKIVIYGPEGIGKTTLAAHFPKTLFIDTEGGTSHMNVDRLDWGDSWTSLLDTVKEVAKSPETYKTLVIDTADWAEQLCTQYVCKNKKVDGIEDIGYGKGYTYVGEEFGKLLAELNKVIDAGMNVVVTAHAKMRKFEQPDELGAYDRWEMKLSRQSAPLLKEWCDMLLFCNYQTNVVTTENKTKKAMGGKRVIYTSHHPCWDAKNRHYMPEKIDMDYENIKGAVEGYPGDPPNQPQTKAQPKKQAEKKKEAPKPIEELRGWMVQVGLEDADIQKACAAKKLQPESKKIDEYDDTFIKEMLLAHKDAFHSYILKKIKNVPADWVNESKEDKK